MRSTRVIFGLLMVLRIFTSVAQAQPVILIDEVPEGGRLINIAQIGMPVSDLRTISLTEFAANLNNALSKYIVAPEVACASYVSLIALAEENPVEIKITRIYSTESESRLQILCPRVSLDTEEIGELHSLGSHPS